MSILFILVFGFVIGLMARAFMPGDQRMGVVMTTLLGIVGSFVGGWAVALITGRPVTEFHFGGVVGSILGAMLVLYISSRTMGRPLLR